MNRQRILILCTGNSARSQMAEGLMRHESHGAIDAFSAGTKPSGLRPEAVAVMKELGSDISGGRSKSVDEFRDQAFDYVITVCDNAAEACPVFPGAARRLHWPFEDPAAIEGTLEEREATFRKVRDQIRLKIRNFLASQA